MGKALKKESGVSLYIADDISSLWRKIKLLDAHFTKYDTVLRQQIREETRCVHADPLLLLLLLLLLLRLRKFRSACFHFWNFFALIFAFNFWNISDHYVSFSLSLFLLHAGDWSLRSGARPSSR